MSLCGKRVALVGSLAAAIACGGGEGTNDPICAEAPPAVLVNDDGVPESVVNEILYDPGPLVSMHLPGQPGSINPSFPSGKIVIIPIDTLDYPRNPYVNAVFLEKVFFDDAPDAQSIYNYWLEQSYGRFEVQKGQVLGWTYMEVNLGDYENDEGKPYYVEGNPEFGRPALELVDVDWDAIDVNDNQVIEHAEAQIIFLFPITKAKPGANTPPGWASVRRMSLGNVDTPSGTFDFGQGRRYIYFSVQAVGEDGYDTDPMRNVPTMNHELAHGFFNLTDRYGRPNGGAAYDSMSSWDSNRWLHLTVHDKMKIGFLEPNILVGHTGQRVRFNPVEVNPSALVLMKEPAAGQSLDPNEYWTVAYRRRDAGRFDRHLPEPAGLEASYVRDNAYSENSAFDDVRLVDFSDVDRDPDEYQYLEDGTNYDIFFKRDDQNPTRELYKGDGSPSGLRIDDVSDAGSQICVTL